MGDPRTPRMLDVAVPGGSLAVLKAGAGPAILFLHGWTLDHRMWQPQLALAGQYALAMPDRRGFGRSTAPADLTAEAGDIDALVPSGRFVLVGLSQGASVALDYARRHPERVAGLMLAGAPLHGVVPDPSGNAEHLPRDAYARQVQAGDLAGMKADWRANPLVAVRADAQPILDAMLADYDGRDLLAGPPRLDIAGDDLTKLPMPVLAVAGTEDNGWRRAVAAHIGATAPRGRSALIQGAGHLCNLDNPGQFNALLAGFLDHHLPRKD